MEFGMVIKTENIKVDLDVQMDMEKLKNINEIFVAANVLYYHGLVDSNKYEEIRTQTQEKTREIIQMRLLRGEDAKDISDIKSKINKLR